ncbi:MAG: hypothetical protein NXY57DRAFT_1114365 [Lentinula lateritia]|nr:MAG: hypothetical protein NXY57DRAFT_1114365 [Lentinula lateritia]
MNDSILFTGILFALSFILSVRLNRRRTEDSTHPLWSLILIQLCGSDIGRLQPTPQYRLYYSEEDITDLDPNKTISGCDVEVIPDFCILLHCAARDQQGTLKSILANTMPIKLPSHSRAIEITSSFVPLLVELKRPVSRNCMHIDQFMSGLGTMMNSAQFQAMDQANCLFSIPNFRRQQEVVLIAAVGEWWSFRFVPRSGFVDTFDGEAYVLDRAEYLKKEQRNNPEAEEYKTKLMDPADIQGMEHYDVQAAQETAQQTKARHDQERNERQRRRVAQRTILHQDALNLQHFVDETQAKLDGIYGNNDINNYSRLRSACDKDWQDVWHLGKVDFMEPEVKEKSMLALNHRAEQWSGVMRLGSQTSDSYLNQIQEYFRQFVQDHPTVDVGSNANVSQSK